MNGFFVLVEQVSASLASFLHCELLGALAVYVVSKNRCVKYMLSEFHEFDGTLAAAVNFEHLPDISLNQAIAITLARSYVFRPIVTFLNFMTEPLLSSMFA